MDPTQPSGVAEIGQAPADEWAIEGETSQSPRKRFDPLDVLPEEIWIAIIAKSASEIHSSTGVIISQDTLLDLMQVSRSWNVQISSAPVLWVDIILKDEYDAAAKAALALHYSRQAPLALYMYYPTGWWDTLQERIMANRVRITKLCFDYQESALISGLVYEGATSSGLILRQLSPLPNLASLHYGPFMYPRWDDIFDYLSDSPIAWVDLLADRDILERRTAWKFRAVRLGCELEDVFDLLEGSEYLREVTVISGFTVPDDKATSTVKNLILHGPPLPWKSLRYRSDGDSFLGAIIGRLRTLVELRIWVSQSIFCHLMPLIFHLEDLSVLEVTLRGKWDRFERLVIPQASTSVREVAVIIGGDASPIMDPVVDALFQSLPNTRLLRVDVVSFAVIRVLTLNTGFQYLQTLRLIALVQWEDTEPESDGILGPFATSVEHVSYFIKGAFLKQLIPPQSYHIKYLDISCTTVSEMELYSKRWTAIRTIGLSHNTTVNWKGPIYQFLHTITFKTTFIDVTSRKGRNATKLCRDIALHPEYFPALSKLEFDTCPELDILFILLETRNVSVRTEISPILTLVIPTRCPPVLVERLQDLVKGFTRGTWGYYDLSAVGNYDIITDPSITGCADCHRAMRLCTRPVVDPSTCLPLLLVKEYPESVTEILESWDARAEQWYPVEETLRYGTCGRSFPLVSITR